MKLRSLLALFMLAVGLTRAADDTAARDRFTRLFTGVFSSVEQSLGDKTIRNVAVHCVRIWPQRTDGTWFYIEHALAEGLDQPYRQRVHQLVATADGALELRIYTLDDPIPSTGAWRQPAPLADLARDRLTLLEGGSIFFREMPDGSFVGGTRGDGCPNDLRGATHATTEMTLTTEKFTFWERGYNAARRQVWGPTNGGYIFKRVAAP